MSSALVGVSIMLAICIIAIFSAAIYLFYGDLSQMEKTEHTAFPKDH